MVGTSTTGADSCQFAISATDSMTLIFVGNYRPAATPANENSTLEINNGCEAGAERPPWAIPMSDEDNGQSADNQSKDTAAEAPKTSDSADSGAAPEQGNEKTPAKKSPRKRSSSRKSGSRRSSDDSKDEGRGRGRGRRGGGSSAPARSSSNIKVDFKDLSKKAWDLFGVDVAEEGVLLIDEKEGRQRAVRSFELARVFLEEKARLRSDKKSKKNKSDSDKSDKPDRPKKAERPKREPRPDKDDAPKKADEPKADKDDADKPEDKADDVNDKVEDSADSSTEDSAAPRRPRRAAEILADEAAAKEAGDS